MAEAKTVKSTARGKELRIKVADNTSMFEVYYYPGGQVPKALSGLYTSHAEAMKAIGAYEATKRA